jgi:hypothetical protein
MSMCRAATIGIDLIKRGDDSCWIFCAVAMFVAGLGFYHLALLDALPLTLDFSSTSCAAGFPIMYEL